MQERLLQAGRFCWPMSRPENEEKITELLAHLAWDNGYTVIVVTHNPGVAKRADVILTMRDGKIRVSDEMGGKGNVYVQK